MKTSPSASSTYDDEHIGSRSANLDVMKLGCKSRDSIGARSA